MEATRALKILERQRDLGKSLRKVERFSPEFKKWIRDTEVAIERIFPKNSRNLQDFQDISYSLSFFHSDTSDYEFQNAYVEGLANADAILESFMDEIREYEYGSGDEVDAPDLMSLIELICLRFHALARQLQARHANRSTLTIEDEYDVQDLLHAILRLHFEDVRAEEWTPSYAGRASRVDFLLKKERIVVEVKKTRSSLKDGDIGEQLIIDRARYEQHPDCDTLVCFVYDPEGRVGNPIGLERDLETYDGKLNFRVIIAPKT